MSQNTFLLTAYFSPKFVKLLISTVFLCILVVTTHCLQNYEGIYSVSALALIILVLVLE